MRIEKEYNVQELANKVKEAIETSYKRATKSALLDIITAQEIVDVLETVASWENKREKICSNENDCKEEFGRECECFGSHISGDKKCNLCVYEKDCINETKEKTKCFGKSYGKRPIIICGLCKYKERCEALTKHE